MARYTGPVCRFCRREGLKLFLKADRCFTDKCSFERNQYPPGQHGQARRQRASDYGLQLREKQKVKRIYGLLEKVDIPSYQLRKGDVLAVREKSQKIQRVVDSLEQALNRPQMSWLELDKDNFSGTVAGWPVREELTLPIQENLIVELYSR
jgi:small subunit ribosomal protein S4